MAFGINNPTRCTIMLNKKEILECQKSDILVYFLCNSGILDITEALRKFCGSFDNIMSVLGKHRNEMTAVYLAKSYIVHPLSRMVVKSGILVRVPSTNLMWRGMHASDAYSMDFIESVKPLQYFCGVLPVSYFVHQRKLLFWKSLFLSENAILASLSRLTAHNFVAVGSLYGVSSIKLSVSAIKHSIWNTSRVCTVAIYAVYGIW